MDREEIETAFGEFAAIVKALRTPQTGCPWDLEQDHHSLKPYLIEEAYEVLDAIDQRDDRALREELGDLLLQVVLHAQLAQDRGAFSLAEVVRGIADKMVRRHPHVFNSLKVSGSAEVARNWDQIKASEHQAKGADTSASAALARLPESLPALMRAQQLGEKAARISFDWTSLASAVKKMREELTEFQAKVEGLAHAVPADISSPCDVAKVVPPELRQQLDHELGDALFGLAQLARWLGLSAEDSLRACTRRFVQRFRRMEQQATRPLPGMNIQELETLWKSTEERSASSHADSLTLRHEAKP
jgi:XTP/dITP diphosphohydrolase